MVFSFGKGSNRSWWGEVSQGIEYLYESRKKWIILEMMYPTNPFKNQSLDTINLVNNGSKRRVLAGGGGYCHFMIRQVVPCF
jgi:hypothetical protein